MWIERDIQEKLFIEVKVQSPSEFKIKNFPELRKVFRNDIPEFLFVVLETSSRTQNIIPIAALRDRLRTGA